MRMKVKLHSRLVIGQQLRRIFWTDANARFPAGLGVVAVGFQQQGRETQPRSIGHHLHAFSIHQVRLVVFAFGDQLGGIFIAGNGHRIVMHAEGGLNPHIEFALIFQAPVTDQAPGPL
jgi:hypothetical protein